MYLAFLILCIYPCLGQKAVSKSEIIPAKSLIGTWQYSTKKVGAGLRENFRFLNNGHFIYCFEPTGNQKFSEIKGTYKILGDELHLIIDSYIEIMGGTVVSGGFGSSLDLFEIYNSTPKHIVLKKPTGLDPLFFSKYDIKDGSIMINSKKFFKISSKIIK